MLDQMEDLPVSSGCFVVRWRKRVRSVHLEVVDTAVFKQLTELTAGLKINLAFCRGKFSIHVVEGETIFDKQQNELKERTH